MIYFFVASSVDKLPQLHAGTLFMNADVLTVHGPQCLIPTSVSRLELIQAFIIITQWSAVGITVLITVQTRATVSMFPCANHLNAFLCKLPALIKIVGVMKAAVGEGNSSSKEMKIQQFSKGYKDDLSY